MGLRRPIWTILAFSAFTVLPLQAQTNSVPAAGFALGLDGILLGQAGPEAPQPYQFDFQEADLSLSGTVDSTWTLFANFEIDPDQPNDDVNLEELFAVCKISPDFQIRVGRGYASFGKQSFLHAYAYPFVIEPMAIENTLGDDGFQDAGLEATWTAPLPWDCRLILGAYEAQGVGPELPLDVGSNSYDNIPYLAHWGNLFSLSGDASLEWGASSLIGMGTDGLHHAVYGTDLTAKSLPASGALGWVLQGEYLTRVGFNSSGQYFPESDGWYGMAQLRWDPSWWTGLRLEEAFNSTTDVLEEDSPDGLIPGHLQRASLNLAWVPSPSSFVRLEYDITRENNAAGSPMDHRVLLQLNYSIGFHTKKPQTNS